MTRVRDHGIPQTRIHHDSLAHSFAGPGRDELLHALHLCLQGERVFTSELRREIAARGVDLESLARKVAPAATR
jgi:hypothetical protein